MGNPEEIISETEDETQGPEMTLPKVPTAPIKSEDILQEIERLVFCLKDSRAKDQVDCDHLQSSLMLYKKARILEQESTQEMSSMLDKSEASLEKARSIISSISQVAAGFEGNI